MSVGLALMALAFSHPMGAAFAFAAVPFLAFAVRPVLVANSAFNVVIALIFPTVFAIAAFSYVSWIFPGDGWTFLCRADPEPVAMDGGRDARLFGDRSCPVCSGSMPAWRWQWRWSSARPIAVVMLRCWSPAAAARRSRRGVCRHRDRRDGDQRAERLFRRSGRDRGCGAGIGCDGRDPRTGRARTSRPDHGAACSGWFGGLASLALVDPITVNHLHGAVGARRRRTDRRADRRRGGRRHDGVLADVDNAPAFVLGRGRARGILGPQSEPFALAMLFARIDTPFVAVPDPQSTAAPTIASTRRFRLCSARALPGYRVIYQNNTWRLFARTNAASALKN